MKKLWLALVRKVLSWIIANCDFRFYTSRVPVGIRLGGVDDPALPDLYFIFGIWSAEKPLLVGYFQKF